MKKSNGYVAIPVVMSLLLAVGMNPDGSATVQAAGNVTKTIEATSVKRVNSQLEKLLLEDNIKLEDGNVSFTVPKEGVTIYTVRDHEVRMKPLEEYSFKISSGTERIFFITEDECIILYLGTQNRYFKDSKFYNLDEPVVKFNDGRQELLSSVLK